MKPKQTRKCFVFIVRQKVSQTFINYNLELIAVFDLSAYVFNVKIWGRGGQGQGVPHDLIQNDREKIYILNKTGYVGLSPGKS